MFLCPTQTSHSMPLSIRKSTFKNIKYLTKESHRGLSFRLILIQNKELFVLTNDIRLWTTRSFYKIRVFSFISIITVFLVYVNGKDSRTFTWPISGTKTKIFISLFTKIFLQNLSHIYLWYIISFINKNSHMY